MEAKALQLEGYRHLLAAELDTTGVRDVLNAGLDAFETELVDFVATDPSLDQPLPLLIETVTTGDSTITSALAMNDLFVLDAINDFQKIFHDLVISNISSALDAADFAGFQAYLENLNDPSIPNAYDSVQYRD